MPEIPDAVYGAAADEAEDADCAHGCHCEYRRCQYPCRSCVARAAVDAVAPILIAEGRRQAAEAAEGVRQIPVPGPTGRDIRAALVLYTEVPDA